VVIPDVDRQAGRRHHRHRSNKIRESMGQGVANIVAGFFGGMGGCAMIGRTMINVKSGARTRLSTFLAGVFLLILVVALGDVVAPMAALVAVMIFVSITTFDSHSLRTIHRSGDRRRRHPRSRHKQCRIRRRLEAGAHRAAAVLGLRVRSDSGRQCRHKDARGRNRPGAQTRGPLRGSTGSTTFRCGRARAAVHRRRLRARRPSMSRISVKNVVGHYS
jgi:hypothetical protein